MLNPLLIQLLVKSMVRTLYSSAAFASMARVIPSICMIKSLSIGSSRANPKDGPLQPQPVRNTLGTLFPLIFDIAFSISFFAELVRVIFMVYLQKQDIGDGSFCPNILHFRNNLGQKGPSPVSQEKRQAWFACPHGHY